ncbi:MAG: hypothetical protein C9356_12000 [Oleiphilus sp.]|nr:MAG: hypothetical protein C9356_12000 [Oleiphilus sp.]
MNYSSVKAQISTLRNEAKRVAQSGYAVVRSRGVFLSGYDDKGQKIGDGEDHRLSGTRKDLVAAIDRLRSKGASVLTINGGFDGTHTVADWGDDYYDPWVSDWSFNIEYRDGQFSVSETFS